MDLREKNKVLNRLLYSSVEDGNGRGMAVCLY